MAQQEIKRIKVILKGATTYTFIGRKFLKNVPEIIEGANIEEFKGNGYFAYSALPSRFEEIEETVEIKRTSAKKTIKKKKLNKKTNSE